MPFVALLIGIILVVVAFNNTHGQLATALEADLPGFFKWGVAIGLLLGLGFIPGLKTPSRWLLALVALVILVTQYQTIFAGISSFAQSGGTATGSAAPDPTAGYVASAGQSLTPASQAQLSGSMGNATQAQLSGAAGSATSTVSGITPPIAATGLSTVAGAASTVAGAASTVGQLASLNPSQMLASLNPTGFLSSFTQSFGGFGGLVEDLGSLL